MTLKVAFIGPAHSGKSTLSSEVYVRLKKLGINAEIVPEWVRYDIHRYGPMITVWEQFRYLHHQRQLEANIPAETTIALCDSGSLAAYFYASLYVDARDQRQRLVLKDLFSELIDDLYCRRYGLIFYLPLIRREDVADGTRYQTAEQLNIVETYMENVFTKIHQLDNVIALEGPTTERVDHVMQVIMATLGDENGRSSN